MSKVLVDRDLLNSALKTIHGLAPGRFTVEQELRAALTAQPAEAEGVEVIGYICGSPDEPEIGHWLDEVASEAFQCQALIRQSDHLAALSAVTAERDRLEAFMGRVEKHAEYWSDHPYAEVVVGIVQEWRGSNAAMAAKEA